MPTSEFNQMLTLLKKLGAEFQENPREYFHENDIHAKFWNLGKGEFEKAETNDEEPEEAITIDLFRHEYNTIWRYSRKGEGGDGHDFNGSFKRRYWGEPSAGCGLPKASEPSVNSKAGNFDFALLNNKFVSEHDALTVINKDESLRKDLRKPDIDNTNDLEMRPVKSKAVLVGVEFKMIHFGQVKEVTKSVFKLFIDGMKGDCRKLGLEGVPYGYSVGFSHGEFENDNVHVMDDAHVLTEMKLCLAESSKFCPESEFRILIFTPTKCYQVPTKGSEITPKEDLFKEVFPDTPETVT